MEYLEFRIEKEVIDKKTGGSNAHIELNDLYKYYWLAFGKICLVTVFI